MTTLNDFIPDNLTIQSEDNKLNHIFDEADCYAMWSAYAAGRPLLVRGKPGTGKSQMAKAIAEQLGWAFVSDVVQGNTELSDLHYHFDAIGRLGDAQASQGQDTGKLDVINYLSPGVFWWAYDWKTAQAQYNHCKTKFRQAPEKPDNDTWTEEEGGIVLLIDEIDKADPDLPNGLLKTLGQYQFSVPFLNKESDLAITNPIAATPSRVLVIISTNEECELPTAFVRRCFVHTLKMEDSTEVVSDDGLQKRCQWLMDRGRLHFGNKISEGVYQKTAELLWSDRSAQNDYPPGLAEYIDLLTALSSLSDHDEQEKRLDKIAEYALQKAVKD